MSDDIAPATVLPFGKPPREGFLTEAERAKLRLATGQPPDEAAHGGVWGAISASAWLKRELPPVERLLGDIITNTSRAFIVGATGLGKTMLGLAIAIGIAFGIGFLHWRSCRPARVLYIDGEMPGDLLKQRVVDAVRRIGRADLLDNLAIYSADFAEELARQYPQLGTLQPLNTEEGQTFMRNLCILLKPDVVIFDNVQALLSGVQKEEESWIAVMPLVTWLSSRRIGQLWWDHTGHNGGRQYGTSTKPWSFDTVGIMSPLPDEERSPYETAFTLSFDYPGKARRRTPDNAEEFAPHVIRLRDDEWSSEPAKSGGGQLRVKPSRKPFHNALINAIAHAGTAPGETTLTMWESECVRLGLLTPEKGQNWRRDLRRAQSDLITANWIAVDGSRVVDRKHKYPRR